MIKTNVSNPYAQQILAKGRDLPEATQSDRKIPARFADRFATFEEYEEAMADFLNGMWRLRECHTDSPSNAADNLPLSYANQNDSNSREPV